MHVEEIRLFNWLRYRGEHRLPLTPTVYGVVARHHADEDRSNWLGKTTLLNAVRFALFGKHPAPVEDGWITRDEPEGGVGLLLSDGTTVERRRERGKATRLGVQLPDGTKAFGDDAQRIIEERVGLTDTDFTATCFFPQKQIARFVTTQPADRMKVIAGWLQLEPLQRAERSVRATLNRCLESEGGIAAEGKAHADMVRELLGRYFDEVGDPTRDEANVEMGMLNAEARRQADAARKRAEAHKGEVDRIAEWRHAAADAAMFDHLTKQATMVGDPTALTAALTAATAAVEQERATASNANAAVQAATTRVRDTERLACGAFDGRCPVDGHVCPDKDAMNLASGRNAKLLAEARAALNAARATHTAALDRLRIATDEQREAQGRIAQQAALLKQAESYRAAKDRIARDGAPPDPTDLEREAAEAWEAYQKAEADAREIDRVSGMVDREFAGVDKCAERLADVRRRIASLQRAVVILGKNGAQRRIAEGALASIADMANDSLAEAGIDLRVDITWSHEGRDLADDCSVCGTPFPRGKAAKTCGRCGATRGPKSIERIEVNLSDVSGAAEDLAGVVIQLAAGAWLRARRGAAWSAAFIDEPFGALDPTNKRALATHLATLLRGRYGFAQAMVVAHDRGIMDAMPGRVVVVADAAGSHPVVS